ncbi:MULTISPECIES: toll/interleukin-1 receptor domain-containing protein [Methylomonas]|uniref:toll/interleukin-1 receptor domain-containing protein n=1 Tax=Methylomonas TaxID=416 RepID=UPI001232111D|nr:toll/interleukin-1 receptor domain-containing protein [Methylomonas rhizoryzae]
MNASAAAGFSTSQSGVPAFADADWLALEQSLSEGNVIPVIGPDALLVEYADAAGIVQTAPFYRLIACDLLQTFGMDAEAAGLQQTWALHKAVDWILASQQGRRVEDRIRREISRLIGQYAGQVRLADSLQRLAEVGAFSLYVSLTPDNLLERALQSGESGPSVPGNSFSLRDSSAALAGMHALQPGRLGVFQMLGNSANFIGGFAIHEEDTLEYLYRLQSNPAGPFKTLLAEMQRRDKLLIGCNLPDWFGRALIRLLNDERLYSKATFEYLSPSISDLGLKSFLTQYSPNTLSFDGPTEGFIDLLWRRFPRRAAPTAASTRPIMTSGGPSVFVSYASQDAVSARLLADSLFGLGFAEVWLDQKKLIGGDDWSDRIEDAIENCDFFMPLLSAQANARREGVFWQEWNLAVARSRRIQDAFLLPVGIDAEPAGKSRYPRIAAGETRAFFDRHLLHAPQGVFDAEAQAALRERCRRFPDDERG